MIQLILNRRDFEYDIYSLIKAFYPGQEIRVFDVVREADEDPEGEERLCRFTVSIPARVQGKQESGQSEQDPGEELTIALTIEKGDGEDAETIFPEGAPRRSTCAVTADMPRIRIKSAVKTLLYDALCELTGRELPWGDLTGIRPVKLAMSRISAGESNADTARFMREEYHVSAAKSALAISIANREKHLLDTKIGDPLAGYSLYVGIPFCPSICLYCSFSSSPLSIWRDRVDDYLDALEREMESCHDLFAPRRLHTVYIGGGTPTTLEPAQMDRLLTLVERYFDTAHAAEFTVEAGRPDSITYEKLRVMADHGIGRISINPQTMNQKTLDLIGRAHSVSQIREAFAMARELGFANINTDLIVGLPGEGIEEVAHTMEEIGRLAPESVTVHALALKRSSRLNLLLHDYDEISFQASDEIMDLTMRENEARGLHPYYLYRQKNMAGNFENVGYAKEGCECLYNILIMEEVQSILAMGAGASTKLVYPDGLIERIENVKDIKSYIERTDEMIGRKQNGTVKYRYR